MEKVVKVLKVFYEATVHCSSVSACISEVVPTVTGLLVTLSQGDGDDGQNINYFVLLEENVQKPSKIAK